MARLRVMPWLALCLAVAIGLSASGCGGNPQHVKVAQAKKQIGEFMTGMESYKMRFKKYPPQEEGLDGLIHNVAELNLIHRESIPPDPWGNAYQYTLVDRQTYRILSYGADGAPGGEGLNSDLSSDAL
ncbi:MAG TPA: type II secretion system protein GspG [Candidatus Hydrogenedentes bacterium]|nr:type II secretion system protein GspG [Candidatus Hydrogenedentota bacterium]HPG67339.1 type II secretion system protein GspG [Candidatus Hydrogenedentota bacterium]